jgi:hypothetical protein
MRRLAVVAVLALLAPAAAAAQERELGPLYVSFAALQLLDAHSTLTSGAREANPVVQPFVARPVAFVALKTATAVGTVYIAERLWRRDRKKALVLMVAVNAAYAAVVARNYRRRQ